MPLLFLDDFALDGIKKQKDSIQFSQNIQSSRLILTGCPGSILKLLIGHFIETLGFDVVQNGLLAFSINLNARHVHGMTPYNYRKSKAVL